MPDPGGSRRLRVHSVFATLQGEGSQVGRPAIFVRFSGCNLWSGLERQRSTGSGACAAWCDTSFVGGELWDPLSLAQHVAERCVWWKNPLCVLTGGEPMLQLAREEGGEFLDALVGLRVGIALETNGTRQVNGWLQRRMHVTVSPKALASAPGLNHVRQRTGACLKVVVPTTLDLDELASWTFADYCVQPRDDGNGPAEHLDHAVDLARRLGWRVSLQTHKLVGLE